MKLDINKLQALLGEIDAYVDFNDDTDDFAVTALLSIRHDLITILDGTDCIAEFNDIKSAVNYLEQCLRELKDKYGDVVHGTEEPASIRKNDIIIGGFIITFDDFDKISDVVNKRRK